MGKTPLEFLLDFFDTNAADECEVSVYTYIPRSVRDDRKIFRIKLCSFSQEINRLCQNLESSEEIAIHSRVYRDGKCFHIPMIDFYTRDVDRASQARDVFKDFNISGGSLFSSGNSYHLYGRFLISQNDWAGFMGRALLLNLPNEEPIVDWRWIGHRLMAGYGCLRLTSNSGKYRKVPEFEKEIFL